MRRRRPKPKPERKPAPKIPAEYCGIVRLLRQRKPIGGQVTLERYAVVKSLAVDIRP
jgi:hypothetical protein